MDQRIHPGFDLNLLLAFEALHAERHVTRAAAKIGLTQSAMSNALRRLRELFKDELFVRGNGEMAPTSVALDLARGVGPALAQIRAAVDTQARFDPATTNRHFVLGLSDIGSFMILPILSKIFREEAPNASMEIVNINSEEAIIKMNNGDVDIASGISFIKHKNIVEYKCFYVDCNVLIDRNNPCLKNGAISLKDFAALPHIFFSGMPDLQADLDAALEKRGMKRRIVISLPHYLAITNAIAGTDLIAIMNDGILDYFAGDGAVVAVASPLPLVHRSGSIIWHRRHENDAGHRWLRQKFENTRQPPSSRRPDAPPDIKMASVRHGGHNPGVKGGRLPAKSR